MIEVIKFVQFLNENVNSDNIEKHLIDLIKIKTIDHNDDEKLYKWNSLLKNIKNYYKDQLKTEFDENGESGVKKLHKEILKSLKRDKKYEHATYVICYDLTEFARNLIKN